MGWIAVVTGVVAMVAIAYGAALGVLWGFAVLCGLGLLMLWLLWRASPLIEVHNDHLRVGRARLPVPVIGTIETRMDDAWVATRRGNDALLRNTAFVVAPPWMPPRAVVCEILDDDPHSGWAVATRNPQQLAEALGDVRQPRDG